MRTQLFTLGIALLLGLPAAASAQARMPHKDAGAIGGEVGVFLPKQDGMTTGPVLEGFYEYYLTARNSVRMGAGWANPKFERESADSMRQIRVAVDLVHNWAGGAFFLICSFPRSLSRTSHRASARRRSSRPSCPCRPSRQTSRQRPAPRAASPRLCGRRTSR